jgi:SAM-dependent methyltransferase
MDPGLGAIDVRCCPQCKSDPISTSWNCQRCGFAARTVDGVPLLAPAISEWTGEDADYTYPELRDAENRHFWFVSRAQLIAWAIRRYFPGAASLFDVGCGTGGVAATIGRLEPSLAIVAGDSQLRALGLAKHQAPRVEFVQCDIRELPFEREFDIAGAFDVLEHLDDDEAVLREMHRVIRPGGGLIITVPQHQWLWSEVDDFSHHRRRYARAELERRIKAAGFQLLRVTSFMTLTLPAMLLSRMRPRRSDGFDATRELRIGDVSNAVLSAACAIERLLITTHVPLPVGGSLLAIARRCD